MEGNFKRFTKQNIIINILLVTLYISFNVMIGDLRDEHIILAVLWIVAYYAHSKTRRFVLGFSFFILFWILYDSMRAIPNYTVNTVHIKQPYNLEKFLFGIKYNGDILTPNEYFAITSNKIFDFLSGFFYINWMPVPLGFGLYLYIKDKKLFLQYSIAFLIINILGFVIYYLYPAAPPWYVAKYGFDLHIGVPGDRAGLVRFDDLVGVPVFKNIYNKNANVLAAMPSLHAAYPLIVLYYAIKKKMKKTAIVIFVIFALGIWFSAIYSNHHYAIDVLAGVILAMTGLFLIDYILSLPYFNDRLQKLLKLI